jgi:hypothetical protein
LPTFCRHNRLIQNCPICSREQQIELRPVISSSAPRTTQPREKAPGGPAGARSPAATRPAASSTRSSSGSRVRVRRLNRGGDDGYRSPLVPGLKSSQEAERLAAELSFAATRLARLEDDPPGLYAEVAAGDYDLEERTWLAFLIAYFGPVEAEDPFSSVRAARTPWAASGHAFPSADDELPDPEAIVTGPRGAHDPGRGTRTLAAYRTWASRAGSQAMAFGGDPAWTPQRRFARAFERLALPGFHRDARFDLLVTLGRLGLYELTAASLVLGGENSVTVGAKRALGIGDPLLLDRRAAELADACSVPLEALDLGLYNWQRGERTHGGLPLGTEPAAEQLDLARAALGV